MKNRVYLLITVLFGILSFSLSEARIMDPNAGAQVGSPSWSVTIPVKNTPSIAQRIAFLKYEMKEVMVTGKQTKPNGDSTSGSLKLPKQNTNQQPKRTHTGGGGGAGKVQMQDFHFTY